MNTSEVKFSAILLVLALSASPLFQKKMAEFEEHYARMNEVLKREEKSSVSPLTPLSAKNRQQLDQLLLAMSKISVDLELAPLSRGEQFNAQSRNFRKEIESLRKQLAQANLSKAQEIVSETALSCGNCHSCRASHH